MEQESKLYINFVQPWTSKSRDDDMMMITTKHHQSVEDGTYWPSRCSVHKALLPSIRCIINSGILTASLPPHFHHSKRKKTMDIYDDVFEDEDADERPSRAPHGAGGVPSRLEGGGTQPLAEGQVALHQAGYRDGAAAGHAIGLQEGFDEGFAQAIQRGCHTGKYLGAVR